MKELGAQGVAPSAAKNRIAYQPALDGMRALAAVAVVGFHLRLPGFWGGALGVDMFFTLSGFLITSILLGEMTRRGTLSFKRFYVRRALRLLPAYFAVVIFAVVSYVLVVQVGGTRRGVISSFFYVANWVAGAGLGGLGTLAHTWSLSVEEQFYLLWPLLLLILFRLARGRSRQLLLAVAAVFAFMWVMTLVAVFVTGVRFDWLNNGTQFRATELLAGCVLAVIVSRGYLRPFTDRRPLCSVVGVAATVGIVALLVFGDAPSNAALISLWFAMSFCTVALIASVQGPTPTWAGRVLSLKPLVALGIVSYGIYLWHFPVAVSIDSMVGLDSALPRIAAVVITAILVVSSYFLLERPFLRLKDRLPREAPRAQALEPETRGVSAV